LDKFSDPEILGLNCQDTGIMKSYENSGVVIGGAGGAAAPPIFGEYQGNSVICR